MEDPVGPDNDRYLAELAAEVDLVVVAWGDLFATRERTERVVEVLAGDGRIPTDEVDIGASAVSAGELFDLPRPEELFTSSA